ncbi:MAG: polymerase sigma factor FliA [Miltoncostaeaceae bacterium]|jgi:RNA polymerase sigma factor for flagellar operon FliA|nr:polymerase sigma factor FliA [Miltoncostaeaceae bacterium]
MVPRPAEADGRRGRAEALPANGGGRELRSLWRRLKEHGDPAARDRLVLHFAPLVKYVAGRMSSALPAHIEEGDLISYGLLGLMNAIERFDPGRQIKFETYAVTRIKGAIIDELRSLDWVPRSVRARARQIERKSAELENKLQRAPTDEEIASALNLSVDEFQDAITQIATSSIVALDEMWTVSSSGEPLSLMDTIGDSRMTDPADVLDVTELRATLADAIARLPEREKIVVALYYYDGLTLREIGEVLGVTESRVSQLHTKAILRLKGRLQGDLERLHAD